MKKILSSVIAGLFACTLFAFPVVSNAQDQTGPSLQSEQPAAPVAKSKKKTRKAKKTRKSPKKTHAKKSHKKSPKKSTKSSEM